MQRVTLTFNHSGHFECRWVRLRPLASSRCLFTRDLDEDILCPVAHGEGRLAVPDESTRQELWDKGLVALQYVAPESAGVSQGVAAQRSGQERRRLSGQPQRLGG